MKKIVLMAASFVAVPLSVAALELNIPVQEYTVQQEIIVCDNARSIEIRFPQINAESKMINNIIGSNANDIDSCAILPRGSVIASTPNSRSKAVEIIYNGKKLFAHSSLF